MCWRMLSRPARSWSNDLPLRHTGGSPEQPLSMSSAFPKRRMGRLPAFVPRITTSRRPVFRGCRYSFMFRPPSLLTPQIVPTAAILPQGSRGFYVRAYRALLPPHAPDMLTVRRQVIDGTGTCTLLDSQPCRLLQCHHHG